MMIKFSIAIHKYPLISPPLAFNKPHTATSKEARELFDWFILVKDERVQILEKAIQTTPGFENWQANFQPESLAELQSWLKKVVETRPMTLEETKEEEAKIKEQFIGILKPPTQTLTSRTVSLAFDAGIYMGEILRRNNKDLKWELCKGKSFNSKQPVLAGFGKAAFNHRLILQNQVGKLLKNKPVDLIKTYKVWVSYLPKK
jgi:hypothetical protein